jgi:hypothetical protein
MNGKYEMTMGPYIWYGYADAATTAQTQEQGTTCTCGYNLVDFTEQNLDKVGIGQDLLDYRLQPERCKSLAGGTENSLSGGGANTCRAGGLKTQLSSDTEIEWAARFDLAPGKYTWSFKPFGAKDVGFSYPDKAMTLYIMASASLDDAEQKADATLKSSDHVIVNQGEELSLTSSKPQSIQFTHNFSNGASADFHFTVPDLGTKGTASYTVFSQHQPWEFEADFFTSGNAGAPVRFHFPTDTRFYDVEWTAEPTTTAAEPTTTAADSSASQAAAVAVVVAIALVAPQLF